MLEARIHHLEQQHKTLDHQIDVMEKTQHFDDMELQYLKKKRLQIRDEIDALKKKQDKKHD